MKRLRSVVSLLLALIVFAASAGVTVNAHICGGEVQSTALFVKAEPCGMMQLAAHMKHVPKQKNKCCDEQTKVIKTSEDNAETGSSVAAPVNAAVILPFIAWIKPVSAAMIFQPEPSVDYPPLPPKDILIATHLLLI